MNTQTQIAKHLKIEASAITRCEEWANVWFVVASGLGARFVSKKVVKMTEIQLVTKRFEGWRGIGVPCDYQEPVLLPGDKVELKGWVNPVIGVVIEVGSSLCYFDVPVATNGPYHVASPAAVTKVWRGDQFLDLKGIGLE